MIRLLRSLGLKPDMAYYASFGSIALSLALWFLPHSTADRKERGQLAIFVGLWPPTLMLLGHALEADEKSETALAEVG
ncbi:MAG TPA: hypothetical protein VMP67_09535 [Candidatus Limnocylindria bacterium]|nr:hypothetical protein [Candidatus Limnocylindria bacterium]